MTRTPAAALTGGCRRLSGRGGAAAEQLTAKSAQALALMEQAQGLIGEVPEDPEYEAASESPAWPRLLCPERVWDYLPSAIGMLTPESNPHTWERRLRTAPSAKAAGGGRRRLRPAVDDCTSPGAPGRAFIVARAARLVPSRRG